MFISSFKVLRNPMLLLYSDKEKCEDEYCHFVSDICHYLHKQNRRLKTAACLLSFIRLYLPDRTHLH